MTDFSKIRTIDELEYQTARIQRRANIQQKKIEQHIYVTKHNINSLINGVQSTFNSIYNTITSYKHTASVILNIMRKLFSKK